MGGWPLVGSQEARKPGSQPARPASSAASYILFRQPTILSAQSQPYRPAIDLSSLVHQTCVHRLGHDHHAFETPADIAPSPNLRLHSQDSRMTAPLTSRPLPIADPHLCYLSPASTVASDFSFPSPVMPPLQPDFNNGKPAISHVKVRVVICMHAPTYTCTAVAGRGEPVVQLLAEPPLTSPPLPPPAESQPPLALVTRPTMTCNSQSLKMRNWIDSRADMTKQTMLSRDAGSPSPPRLARPARAEEASLSSRPLIPRT